MRGERAEFLPGFVHPALAMYGLDRRMPMMEFDPGTTRVDVPIVSRYPMRSDPVQLVPRVLHFELFTVQTRLDPRIPHPKRRRAAALWHVLRGHCGPVRLNPSLGCWFWHGFRDEFGRTLVKPDVQWLPPT